MNPHVEFSLKIGCKGACIKFCPQEKVVLLYQDTPHLSFESFSRMVNKIPATIDICFSGVSEPSENPDYIRMILYAYRKGHGIMFNTNLSDVTIDDAMRLCQISFTEVMLHLPDSCGNLHIPQTQEYLEVKDYMERHIDSIYTMSMNKRFVSHGREDIHRGKSTILRSGRISCYRIDTPGWFVMPNGDVFPCCMTFGLCDKVGNLLEQSYEEIDRAMEIKYHTMSIDPNSICHICKESRNYWKTAILKVLRKIWD